MIGFSAEGGRQTHVYGTKGEVFLNEQTRTITLQRFGEEKHITEFDSLASDFSGHGGGDVQMIKDVLALMSKGQTLPRMTFLNNSVLSHKMAFAAEASRLAGGAPVAVGKNDGTRGVF